MAIAGFKTGWNVAFQLACLQRVTVRVARPAKLHGIDLRSAVGLTGYVRGYRARHSVMATGRYRPILLKKSALVITAEKLASENEILKSG